MKRINTGPDGAAGMHLVRISVPAPTQNGFFNAPMGRCKATIPSSFALTCNMVNTNY